MKAVFIPTQYTGKADFNKIQLGKLPNTMGIVTTTQFINTTKEIIQYLKNNKKEIFIDKIKQKNEGQLLGCDQGAALKVQNKVDAFLYIGSGEFHPLGVALKTNKDVFTFNPVTNAFSKLNKENIEQVREIMNILFSDSNSNKL